MIGRFTPGSSEPYVCCLAECAPLISISLGTRGAPSAV